MFFSVVTEAKKKDMAMCPDHGVAALRGTRPGCLIRLHNEDVVKAIRSRG